MRKFGRFLGFPGFRVLKSGRLLFWLLGFTRNHPNQGARWFLEVASFRWFPVFFVSAPVLYRRSSLAPGLVLDALLCGSEIWCLSGDLYHRPRRFDSRCARIMCRITTAQTTRHRITTRSLLSKPEIGPLDTYYSRRLLRGGPATSRACPCPGHRENSRQAGSKNLAQSGAPK